MASNFAGKKILILGAGVTGIAVANSLSRRGAAIHLADDQVTEVSEFSVAATNSFKATDFDGVVVSPGWKADHALITEAQKHGVPLLNEVDLAWQLRGELVPSQRWLALTGTNGKTTTVEMTAAMLRAGGVSAIACGNVGTTVIESVESAEKYEVLVLELSSFQLHWIKEATFVAASILNIAEDHLDWHGSRENYIADKAKIYHNTSVACVYNKADVVTMRMVEDAEVHEGARAIGFDLGAPGMSDIGIVNGVVCDRAFVEDRRHTALEITTLEDLTRQGLNTPHMVSNIMAATALARSYGVTPEAIRHALSSFQSDSHRNEVILHHEEIAWVDDSKATNAHAADASLSSYSSVVWIVGGLLKGTQLDDLVKKHSDRVRAAVIIGLERESVLSSFQRHAPQVKLVEVIPTETSDVMVDAVKAASELAKGGDTVLLAPAAASMDQFIDYAERGRLFAQAVKQTYGGEADGDSASDTI
jgi:UDP-N-acetylmuramoylalanine--D-glutamate ligase